MKKEQKIMKKVIRSQKTPGVIGPYSQAIEANGMVFVSDQLPTDVAIGVTVEGAEIQACQPLEGVKHILEETGSNIANTMKVTVLSADVSLFADMDKVHATHSDGVFPARLAVVIKTLPRDAPVETECIAVR